MTDGTALLRSVLTFPEEDTPRLVLADYLDEQGEHDRAEFVRVQVEIARMFCAGCRPGFPCRFAGQCRKMTKIRREAALLTAANALAWGLARPLWADGLKVPLSLQPMSGHVCEHFTRGFVSRIELPCAAFLEHAAAIFAAQPVTAVVLSDSVPLDCPGEGQPGAYAWARARKGDRVFTRWEVPFEIWTEELNTDFATPEDAIAALSRRCVAFGRKLAGLPPLPQLATASAK